jgi:hypothetical protein
MHPTSTGGRLDVSVVPWLRRIGDKENGRPSQDASEKIDYGGHLPEVDVSDYLAEGRGRNVVAM